MRLSSSTIGFSKSSQVPFMSSGLRTRSEGSGRAHGDVPAFGALERHRPLAEASLQLRDQILAHPDEKAARANLGLGGIVRGAREEVYRGVPRVAMQQLPQHLQR